MGKRARKPKKMGDGSLASVACVSPTQPAQKPKRKPLGSKRTRKEARETGGSTMPLVAPPLDEPDDHMQSEEEDVDIMGSDDILQSDLGSSSNHFFTVKEEDDACGPDRPLADPMDTKSSMFDPSYELHNGLDCLPDYEVGLQSEADSGKPQYLSDDALVPVAAVGQDFVQCSLPTLGLAGDGSIQTNGRSMFQDPGSVINGCVPENGSMMIPTSVMGAEQGTTATTTAFAQVTKIEEGPDGKGYILHLNIPALGLTNMILSTPGLSLAPGMDEKILAAGSNGALPSLMNMASGDAAGLDGVMAEQLSDEGVDNASDGDSPSGFGSSGPALCGLGVGELGQRLDHNDAVWEDEENGLFEGEHSGIMEGSQSSSSSDSGCGLSADQEAGSSGSGSGPETDGQECTTALINVARWAEKPEVERFVICSDGPMECVLCAFKTVDYSAFKSHIICSHPCWRITKKLSKNRLLVEKSVKMNVNLVPQPVAQQHAKVRRPSSGKDKESSSEEGFPPNVNKSKKGLQVYQRKKQMLERNKRLFRCSLCMRLFVFEGSIVNHIVDIHLVKTPYDHIQVSNNHGMTFEKIRRCSHDNCYASCLTEEELERHRIESHAQVVYRCQICGFAADTSDAIEKHASLIHSQYDLMYGLAD